MMKHKKFSARILSLVLSAEMLFTTLPVTVFATEGVASRDASGIIECHQEHDEDCGYKEAAEGADCFHKNEDGTYSCVSDAVSDNTATPGNAESSICTHEDDCGYTKAVEGAECTHSCDICKPLDSGSADKQPAQEQCSCGVLCTEEKINTDCSVCSAKDADLADCKGDAVEKSAYDKVIELFTALPDISVVKSGLTADAKDELIAQVASALEAYEALSEEDRARFETEQHDLLVSAVALSGELWGALPMVMLEGGDTLTLGALDPDTKTFKDAVGTGTGKYQSIIVGFTLSQADASEAITLPTDITGYAYQSAISSPYANIITVDDSNGKTAAEIAREYIRKIEFNGGSAGQSVAITLNYDRLIYRTFSWGGNGHFYQYVPFPQVMLGNTWLAAYDKAKGMTYNGRTGYLATVTSKEEDLFIREASGSVGWLGGTRMALADGVTNEALAGTQLSAELFKPGTVSGKGTTYEGTYWYWACGPEAGDTFYDVATVTKSDYQAVHTRNQEAGHYFNWEISNGQEPNSGTAEAALATLLLTKANPKGVGYITGPGYSWNDLSPSAKGNGGSWDSQGFFVEYGDQISGDSGSSPESGSIGDSTDIEAPFPQWLTDAGLTAEGVAYLGRLSTVKLKQEVTLTNPIVLPANRKVTIDLNGNALTPAADQPVIKAASGSAVELTLTDTSSGSTSPALVGPAGQPAIDFSRAGAGSKVILSGGTSVKGGNGGTNNAAGGDGIKGSANTTIVVDADSMAAGGSGGAGENGGGGVTGGSVTINGAANGGTGGANTAGAGGNGGIGASGTTINGSGAATGGDGGGGITSGSGGKGISGTLESGSTLTVTDGNNGVAKTSVTITGLAAPNPAKVYDGTAIENSAFGTPSFNPTWTGTLTYIYYKDSVLPANKLISAPSDAGSYVVVATIPETDATNAGSVPIRFTIWKGPYSGAQAAAPDASTATKKETSITLAPVTPPSGETVEYGYSPTNTAPSTWQDSTAFGSLTAATDYYFFARVKATNNHEAGSTSAGTKITTEKGAYSGTPAATPSVATKDDTSVTLATVTSPAGEAVEYAKSTTNSAPTDDSAWQTGTSFSGLTPNTKYYFFARVKSNATHEAGGVSSSTSSTTNKSEYTTKPSAPSSTPAAKTDTSITLAPVTAPSGEAVEYGYTADDTQPTSWQDGTVFTGLTSDKEYHFFTRVKENEIHKAGPASTGTKIKTDLSDTQKMAAAKKAVDDALKALTATNATDADAIIALANKALTEAGITGVRTSWDVAFSKNESTEEATGKVIGTVKLTCGSASDTVAFDKTIAKLPSDPAEKIRTVKAAIEAAISAYRPANTTTAADVKAIADKANADSGVTGVKVAWKIPSDFSKTDSTNSADGKITGTFDLSCTTSSGSAAGTVSVNRPIERTDEQKLADAKAKAEAAVAAMKATNATTDADVLAVAHKALSDAGLTYVTTAWKTAPDGFNKVLATEGAAGSITGKIELTLNGKKSDVNAKLPIARLVADKTALKDAIATANKAKTGIEINNNLPDKVANGKKFVTTAEMNAFNDAIEKALSVTNNTYATTAEVTKEVENLATAVKAFNDAIKTGTQTGGGKKPVGSITISVATTTTAGKDLTLTGIITPANATNKNIVWSVKSAGATGATIVGNTLKTTGAGTVVVTATIKDGIAAGLDYTQDFTITVLAAESNISGTVKDESNFPIANAKVELVQGETVKKTATTDTSGIYSFIDVENGFYKIVVTTNMTPSSTVTETIVVAGDTVTKDITVLGGNRNTVVVSTPGTPEIAVGGMNDLLDASNIEETLTSAEKAAVDANGSVELKFVADKRAETEVAADKSKIEAVAIGKKIDTFLDLSMLKTVKDSGGTVLTSGEKIQTLAAIIEVQLQIPANLQGKTGLSLYRVHSGTAEALQKDLSDANGEYYIISDDDTFMTLYVKNFSTYALGYTAFTVTMTDSGTGARGAASYNPGENVTIIAGSKSGYTFNGWTVAIGTIGLADASKATTTFTMPNENVTVNANWRSNGSGGSGGSGGGSSSDHDEYDFWMSVKEKIQKAGNGDVVKVNAKDYDKMPSSVMDALRKNDGVSLVITWNGKTITIPAGKAAKNESRRIYWSLSKLAELYVGIAEDTVLKSVPQNPETGGPIKFIPVTGGGELITLEAPSPAVENAILGTTANTQAIAPAQPKTITPPDAGFEPNAYVGTPDQKAARGISPVAVAVSTIFLAILGGGGVWFWERRTKEKMMGKDGCR